jgi:di/tricarboxylate transporter
MMVAILTLLIVFLLIWDKFKASSVFAGGALAMVLLKAIDIEDLLNSFSNKSVVIIFLLIYLTSIIHRHYPLLQGLDRLFKKAKSPRAFIFQMTSSVSLLSSVMNNTPIVALFIPYVYEWAKKNKISPSQLLIPLSFAAIFGGMITVIGTSTNLVLNGFLLSNGQATLGFMEFLIPGLAVSTIGILFLTFGANKLLPNHPIPQSNVDAMLREYLAETRLNSTSPLIGQTITKAGLRNLNGVYLAEIYREGKLLPSVSPAEILKPEDRLFFAGDIQNVVEVIKQHEGLVWAKNAKFEISEQADVVETVIPANSILQGKNLKEIGFREAYDAAVIGIHRNGERIKGNLGEIILKAGDLLLLTVGPQFKERIRKGKDLYMLKWIDEQSSVSQPKRILLLILIGSLIVLSITGLVDFAVALMLMMATAVILGMFGSKELKQQTNLELLLVLGGAIAVGKGFIDSGAASLLMAPLLDMVQAWSQASVILMLFLLTLLFTSFVTNVAAVAIVFPIAFELVQAGGYNPTSIYLTLAFGASAAFLTPVSYQTNLMVYGPGKYKFKDFLKIGIPFTLCYAATALITIIILHG